MRSRLALLILGLCILAFPGAPVAAQEAEEKTGSPVDDLLRQHKRLADQDKGYQSLLDAFKNSDATTPQYFGCGSAKEGRRREVKVDVREFRTRGGSTIFITKYRTREYDADGNVTELGSGNSWPLRFNPNDPEASFEEFGRNLIKDFEFICSQDSSGTSEQLNWLQTQVKNLLDDGKKQCLGNESAEEQINCYKFIVRTKTPAIGVRG